jgi:hypothetical protein
MINIQQTTHLSNSKMRKLASCINKFSPKGSGVESYFQEKFAKAGQSTDFFSKENLKKSSLEVPRTIISCNDLESFLWHILKERGVCPQEILVKLSLSN